MCRYVGPTTLYSYVYYLDLFIYAVHNTNPSGRMRCTAVEWEALQLGKMHHGGICSTLGEMRSNRIGRDAQWWDGMRSMRWDALGGTICSVGLDARRDDMLGEKRCARWDDMLGELRRTRWNDMLGWDEMLVEMRRARWDNMLRRKTC